MGFGFQAPAWVPGTQDFLYVDSTGPSPVGGSEANPGESDLEGTVADAPRGSCAAASTVPSWPTSATPLDWF